MLLESVTFFHIDVPAGWFVQHSSRIVRPDFSKRRDSVQIHAFLVDLILLDQHIFLFQTFMCNQLLSSCSILQNALFIITDTSI